MLPHSELLGSNFMPANEDENCGREISICPTSDKRLVNVNCNNMFVGLLTRGFRTTRRVAIALNPTGGEYFTGIVAISELVEVEE